MPAALAGRAGAAGDRDRSPQRLRARIVDKLTREPVEDYRIDFEDGYGHRPDAEEDAHSVSVATEVAEGFRRGTLPPFIGIRIKPVSAELHRRSLRTLDLFVTALARALDGGVRPGIPGDHSEGRRCRADRRRQRRAAKRSNGG